MLIRTCFFEDSSGQDPMTSAIPSSSCRGELPRGLPGSFIAFAVRTLDRALERAVAIAEARTFWRLVSLEPNGPEPSAAEYPGRVFLGAVVETAPAPVHLDEAAALQGWAPRSGPEVSPCLSVGGSTHRYSVRAAAQDLRNHMHVL